MKRRTKAPLVVILAAIPVMSQGPVEHPVYTILQDQSSVKFYVKASVELRGTFDKWDTALTCASTDPASCVLNIKVQAASVNTGSGMKDGKLRSKNFFDVKENPSITFKSTKVEQTGPHAFNVIGVFTIRGVSKPETLILANTPESDGAEVKGQMAFDRRDYGMNHGIPFIKIADRVEVNVNLKARRSGPPLDLKQ